MAGQAPADGSLLAMIVDEDTATGMLLTGVGHVDLRKKSNFLIVDESECLVVAQGPRASDLVSPVRSRLAARLHRGPRRSGSEPPPPWPWGAVSAETTQQRIEEAFKEFTNREDIAVLLINQTVRPERGRACCYQKEACRRGLARSGRRSPPPADCGLYPAPAGQLQPATARHPGDPQQGPAIRPLPGLHPGKGQVSFWGAGMSHAVALFTLNA